MKKLIVIAAVAAMATIGTTAYAAVCDDLTIEEIYLAKKTLKIAPEGARFRVDADNKKWMHWLDDCLITKLDGDDQ